MPLENLGFERRIEEEEAPGFFSSAFRTGLDVISPILTALDTPGRAVRTLFATGDFSKAANSIFDVESGATGRDVLSAFGFDGVSEENSNNGKFEWSDTIDFAAEMATEIALDPLTYLTLGATKAGEEAISAFTKGNRTAKNAKLLGEAGEEGIELFARRQGAEAAGEFLGRNVTIKEFNQRVLKGGHLDTLEDSLRAGEKGIQLGFGRHKMNIGGKALAPLAAGARKVSNVTGKVIENLPLGKGILGHLNSVKNFFRTGTGIEGFDQLSSFTNEGFAAIRKPTEEMAGALKKLRGVLKHEDDLAFLTREVEKVVPEEHLESLASIITGKKRKTSIISEEGRELQKGQVINKARKTFRAKHGLPWEDVEKSLSKKGYTPEEILAVKPVMEEAVHTVTAQLAELSRLERAAGASVNDIGGGLLNIVKDRKNAVLRDAKEAGISKRFLDATGDDISTFLNRKENAKFLKGRNGENLKKSLRQFDVAVENAAEVPGYMPLFVSDETSELLLKVARDDPSAYRSMVNDKGSLLTIQEANEAVRKFSTKAIGGKTVTGTLDMGELAKAFKNGWKADGLDGQAKEIAERMAANGNLYTSSPADLLSRRTMVAAKVIQGAEFASGVRNVFGEAIPAGLVDLNQHHAVLKKAISSLEKGEGRRKALTKGLLGRDLEAVEGSLKESMKELGEIKNTEAFFRDKLQTGKEVLKDLRDRETMTRQLIKDNKKFVRSTLDDKSANRLTADIRSQIKRMEKITGDADIKKETLQGIAEARVLVKQTDDIIASFDEQIEVVIEAARKGQPLDISNIHGLSPKEEALLQTLSGRKLSIDDDASRFRALLKGTNSRKKLQATVNEAKTKLIDREGVVAKTFARIEAQEMLPGLVQGKKINFRKNQNLRKLAKVFKKGGRDASTKTRELASKFSNLEEGVLLRQMKAELIDSEQAISNFTRDNVELFRGKAKASSLGMGVDPKNDFLVSEEIATAIAARNKVAASPEVWSGMMRSYRQMNGLWKSMQLAWPTSVARNMIGNAAQMAAGGVIPHGEDMMQAGRLMLAARKGAAGIKELDAITFNIGGKVMKGREFLEEVHLLGALDTGFFASEFSDLGSKFRKAGVARKGLDLPVKINEMAENFSKIVFMLGKMRQGASMESASLDTAKFLFNYRNVSSAVAMMRKTGLAPFAAWSAKNIPLQLEMLYTKPASLMAMMHAKDVMEDKSIPDKEKELLLDNNFGIAVKKHEDGSIDFVKLENTIPAADIIGFSRAFRSPKDAVEFVTSMIGPAFKIPAEFMLNRDAYTKKRIQEWDGQLAALPVPGREPIVIPILSNPFAAHAVGSLIGRPAKIYKGVVDVMNGKKNIRTGEPGNLSLSPFADGGNAPGAFRGAFGLPIRVDTLATEFDRGMAVRDIKGNLNGAMRSLKKAVEKGNTFLAEDIRRKIRAFEKDLAVLKGTPRVR